jgi:hypothetical protein
MEIVGLIVSIIALAVSVISILLAKWAVKEQRRISTITANYAALASADALLEGHEEWLSLFNVDEEVIGKCNLTTKELLYLTVSFNAAELSHRIDGTEPIELGKYRENLLRNEKVQMAWQYIIRDKFSEYDPFVKAVDKFIKQEQLAVKEKISMPSVGIPYPAQVTEVPSVLQQSRAQQRHAPDPQHDGSH